MEIRNLGRGIHAREMVGITEFRKLPDNWFAFTNLEMSVGPGQSREIDMVMVTDDRVLLVDLKDWNERITSGDGRWFHGGRDMGTSPVEKIRANARNAAEVFKLHLRNLNKSASSEPKLLPPLFQGVVVQLGRSRLDEISANESSSAFMVDDFVEVIADQEKRSNRIGSPKFANNGPSFVAPSGRWRRVFDRFFNSSEGQFRPGRRRYSSFRATSDSPTFSHPSGYFSEFDVEDENTDNAAGLLRRWEFSQLDPHFQTEAGRREIAGREQRVIAFLNDRNPAFGGMVLQPKVEDVERSVGYWEIFEKRKRLKRLSEFVKTEARFLSNAHRIDLAKHFLACVVAIHHQDVAHSDIGPHSVWLEAPSVVRVSHLHTAWLSDHATFGHHQPDLLSTTIARADLATGDGYRIRARDCLLAGIVTHEILFGSSPTMDAVGDAPRWDPTIDTQRAYERLHPWFETIFSATVANRFSVASVMADGFIIASDDAPSLTDLADRLERFRGWRSQRQIFLELPSTGDLFTDDRVEIWYSNFEGSDVLVKMWKRAAWGDTEREAPRLLAFIERAETLMSSPPRGCVPIRKICWTGDALVVVEDRFEAPSLERVVAEKVGPVASVEAAMRFVSAFASLVVELHGNGIAHGDLKPKTVFVRDGEGYEPLLVNYVDLLADSGADAGGNTYSPPTPADRFCQDRFAVGKIAEEMFAACDSTGTTAVEIARAIQKCRAGPPENATLLPLIETLERLLSPQLEETIPTISLSIKNAEPGHLFSDEGIFGLRFAITSPFLAIRGASEEINVRLDDRGTPVAAWRRPVEQKRISALARHEFARIAVKIDVRSSTHTDLSGLSSILTMPSFEAAWAARTRVNTPVESANDDPFEAPASGDLVEDEIADAIVADPSERAIDVPLLWQTLMLAEENLTIAGEAIGDSIYKPERRRHFVAFELEEGTFEFARDDKVSVEKLDGRGTWRELGLLDISLTNPSLTVIDATRRLPHARHGLIVDGTKLRFTSHFETTSRTRRDVANTRILRRQSAIQDLIDYFDPRSGARATLGPDPVTKEEVQLLYGLNDTQAEAFVHLIRTQPMGLLQGPPGTGKTRFIGALVHFALTRNLARNVLLSSQSNEAVNNAAEAILGLFDEVEERPSIVRVGSEGAISDRLLTFHSGRVEASYKHRFQSSFKQRMRLIARNLGISQELSDDLTFLEQAVRPVVERYEALLNEESLRSSAGRIGGLRRTIARMVGTLDIAIPSASDLDGRLLDHLVGDLISKHATTNEQAVTRFRSVARLARDFVGSVSTYERSFETFLAGTRQIVAGTCVGLGRSSLGLTKTPFDLVIIDEAARCTSSELAVPLQSGRWIVLVGDQAQLEPQHKPEVVMEVAASTQLSYKEIKRSDFERVFASEFGRFAGRQLKQQYRMLPAIGRIVSAAFYSQSLSHERRAPIIDLAVLPGSLGKPVTWITTDGGGARAYESSPEDRGSSLVNPAEAETIAELLIQWDRHRPFRSFLEQQDPSRQTIGIICGYSAQRDLIRHKLRIAGLSQAMKSHVTIGTIDSYQGKQNPIIILSLVRNNASGRHEAGRATINQGFMVRPNRINVAISRAMDRLILVGARARWPSGGPMHRVAEAFMAEVIAGEASVIDAAAVRGELRAPRSERPKRSASKLGGTRDRK